MSEELRSDRLRTGRIDESDHLVRDERRLPLVVRQICFNSGNVLTRLYRSLNTAAGTRIGSGSMFQKKAKSSDEIGGLESRKEGGRCVKQPWPIRVFCLLHTFLIAGLSHIACI